jgi:hypothetical protein
MKIVSAPSSETPVLPLPLPQAAPTRAKSARAKTRSGSEGKREATRACAARSSGDQSSPGIKVSTRPEGETIATTFVCVKAPLAERLRTIPNRCDNPNKTLGRPVPIAQTAALRAPATRAYAARTLGRSYGASRVSSTRRTVVPRKRCWSLANFAVTSGHALSSGQRV